MKLQITSIGVLQKIAFLTATIGIVLFLGQPAPFSFYADKSKLQYAHRRAKFSEVNKRVFIWLT